MKCTEDLTIKYFTGWKVLFLQIYYTYWYIAYVFKRKLLSCFIRDFQGHYDLNCQYDIYIHHQTLDISATWAERKSRILVIKIIKTLKCCTRTLNLLMLRFTSLFFVNLRDFMQTERYADFNIFFMFSNHLSKSITCSCKVKLEK